MIGSLVRRIARRVLQNQLRSSLCAGDFAGSGDKRGPVQPGLNSGGIASVGVSHYGAKMHGHDVLLKMSKDRGCVRGELFPAHGFLSTVLA